eukprot:1971492-Rhodomonas_salina.2
MTSPNKEGGEESAAKRRAMARSLPKTLSISGVPTESRGVLAPRDFETLNFEVAPTRSRYGYVPSIQYSWSHIP